MKISTICYTDDATATATAAIAGIQKQLAALQKISTGILKERMAEDLLTVHYRLLLVNVVMQYGKILEIHMYTHIYL